MKYCPNPQCPTLKEIGMVAEYEDHVEVCEDCGETLIAAHSPPDIAAAGRTDDAPAFEALENATLVGGFEVEEDAEACRVLLERSDIPTRVERAEEDIGVDDESAQDVADTQVVYYVYVRGRDGFRSMQIIDSLFPVETDAEDSLAEESDAENPNTPHDDAPDDD